MRLVVSRRSKIGLAVVLGVLVGALGFGPAVRSRVAKEAASRGLVVTVESVRPGWFAVELRGVGVQPEGVSGVSVTLDEVRIEVGASLSIQEVVASGVSGAIDATPEELDDCFQAWRARHPAGANASPSDHVTPVRLEQAKLHWAFSARDEANITGASATRDQAGWHLAAEQVDVLTSRGTLRASSASLDLDGSRKLSSAHAAGIDVALAIQADSPSPIPIPPIPPPSQPKKDEAFVPLVELPDLHVLRGRARALAAALSSHATPDARVDVDALTLSLAG